MGTVGHIQSGRERKEALYSEELYTAVECNTNFFCYTIKNGDPLVVGEIRDACPALPQPQEKWLTQPSPENFQDCPAPPRKKRNMEETIFHPENRNNTYPNNPKSMGTHAKGNAYPPLQRNENKYDICHIGEGDPACH